MTEQGSIESDSMRTRLPLLTVKREFYHGRYKHLPDFFNIGRDVIYRAGFASAFNIFCVVKAHAMRAAGISKKLKRVELKIIFAFFLTGRFRVKEI